MSLDSFESHFSSQLSSLESMLELVSLSEEEREEQLLELSSTISSIKQVLAEFREEKAGLAKGLEDSERLVESIRVLHKRNLVALENIPSHCNSQGAAARSVSQNAPPVQRLQFDHVEPPSCGRPLPKLKLDDAVLYVAYSTVKEFEAIPKYMKGRIKYEALNSAVDEINAALDAKYDFLARPLNSLKPKEKTRRNQLRSLETKELKGIRFVTSDDFSESKLLKAEGSRRNYFQILRHLRKIREVRGPGNLVKYVVEES